MMNIYKLLFSSVAFLVISVSPSLGQEQIKLDRVGDVARY